MSLQQIDMVIHLLTHPLDHEEALRELDAMVRFSRGGVFALVSQAERPEEPGMVVPPGKGARRT